MTYLEQVRNVPDSVERPLENLWSAADISKWTNQEAKSNLSHYSNCFIVYSSKANRITLTGYEPQALNKDTQTRIHKDTQRTRNARKHTLHTPSTYVTTAYIALSYTQCFID